jgi:SNF2 family DNA or RNA helicase
VKVAEPLSSSLHRKLWSSSKNTFEKLDGYQKEAVEFVLRVKTAALVFEQGTGKTWIATGVIEALADNRFSGLLVVPLNNLETTWLATLSAQVPQVKLCRSLDELKKAPCPRLLIVHYEALPKIVDKVRKLEWDLIAYDESQRLRQRSSLTSRTASKLKHCGSHRIILTGTPLDKAPQEFWAQFRFLNVSVFGDRWKDFEDYYIEPLNFDLSKYRPGSMAWRRLMKQKQIAERRRRFDQRKLPEFLEEVSPYCMSVKARDVLDLPGLMIHESPVRLRGVQRQIYEELENDLVTYLSASSSITAPLRVTQIVKLRQVCGGFVLDDAGDPVTVGLAKLRRVSSLIKRVELPVVIFCCYTEEVLAISEELVGLRVETLTGRTKKQDRPELIRRFQGGEIDVLVCQIKTGGVGIDLYRASVAIIYSLPYSYIDYAQAIKRIHRRGQEKDCDVFLLYAEGTVDEDCLLAIKRKGKVTDMVLDRLRRHRNGKGKGRGGQE